VLFRSRDLPVDILLEKADGDKLKKDINSFLAYRYEQLALTVLYYDKPLDSMKYYKKSIYFLEKAKGDNSFAKEWIYRSLAGTYLYIGKKEEALMYYEKSLKASEERDCSNLERASSCGATVYLLLYCDMAKEALKFIQKGLDYLKDEKESDEVNNSRAWLLCDLAEAHFKMGNYPEAVKVLEEAMNTAGTIKERGFNLMAEIYLAGGDPKKALEYKLQYSSEDEDDFLFLARAYLQMGEYDKALEYNRMAMEKLKNSRWPDGYLEGGEIFEASGEEESALEAYKASVEALEGKLNILKLEEYKIAFMNKYTDVYDKIITLLLKTGRDGEAFQYSERARARAFLDSLANNRVDSHSCNDSELIKKIEELENEIKIYSDKENRDEGRIEELKWEYEEKLEELKLKNPEYASFKTVSPPSLEEIQSLLDKDTAVLEYFSLEEELILWIITEDDIFTGTIPVSRKDLKDKIIFYREQIATGMTAEKLQSDEWKNTAKGFYDLLIGDWENLIEDKKRLVIVPHRSLHYLPFHTFMNSEGKFLIEKYEITYLPSAGTLGYCREKNTDKKEKLVAFEYGNLGRPYYPPLPWSIKEVDAIRKIYPQNEVYKAEEITEDNIKSACEKADLIHFATHGILDGEAPMLSKLVLSEEDLEVYEIFDLKLSACLVTLSACRTGLGELSDGDDLVGFSRAFIYAGTPTVCVSLWDVSDKATAELMERFYFHLQDKEKGEALRLAMLEMKEKYPHPFFWAPFVIIGDWR